MPARRTGVLVTVTDETDAEIREAITHLAADAARLPAHWVEQRAAKHERINDLLTKLDERGA